MLRNMALLAVLAAAAAGCSGDATAPSPAMLIKVTPDTLATLSADVALTITGADFGGSSALLSQAVWYANGRQTLLATTFVSSTEIQAVIPAALLASPVRALVWVQTGDPFGDGDPRLTNTASVTVVPPSGGFSISPSTAPAGRAPLTLTVVGSGFRERLIDGETSQVVWSVNGHETPLVTTYFSDQALTAVVPADLLAQPVMAQVFVETGDPMGDLPPTRSPSASFTVTP